MVKTECNVKLEVADKGLVQVAGVVDISFCSGSLMYTWHVLIAPIEEEGLLGMNFLLVHNADSLSRAPCDPTECLCYDGHTVLTCHVEDVMCVRRNMNSGHQFRKWMMWYH